jgi:hypothetical protein
MDDTERAEIRVSFGTRDDDTMPLTWCERGLTFVHENYPQVFAAMMLHIVDVSRKRRS